LCFSSKRFRCGTRPSQAQCRRAETGLAFAVAGNRLFRDLPAKARKALPDDPELAELLGRLSYEKKEYPRAIQLFQESARKRPLEADSLFYLGMSQLQASQKAEARGTLNQALADGLQEPLASEAKRALADLQRE
jgi:tetratricopeptide (TPR) repeat protein